MEPIGAKNLDFSYRLLAQSNSIIFLLATVMALRLSNTPFLLNFSRLLSLVHLAHCITFLLVQVIKVLLTGLLFGLILVNEHWAHDLLVEALEQISASCLSLRFVIGMRV